MTKSCPRPGEPDLHGRDRRQHPRHCAGIRELRKGRLNDRALTLLIQHAAPHALTQKEVKNVLAGINNLEREYLKPASK